ncbi:MAG: protein TolQ [Alphaproteobacteria bacterium]|nr:protein TolQ [Alphaproteobacteria bacterium]
MTSSSIPETATTPVDAAEIAGTAAGAMPHHDLSIVGLFMSADLVVQFVMLTLIGMSIWCWTIIIYKRLTLKKLNRRADRFEEAFWSGEPLDKLFQRVKKSPPDPLLTTFTAGMEEWQAGISAGIPTSENLQASLKQRVERAMSLAIIREMQILERGMTFLATTGSTATFIGLFGTVWGIMNSFTAIASMNNTSLAVVAPGIAEALFATATGLVAAIPAMVGYNVFSTALARYADRLSAFSAEFSAIMSRHLDSQERPAKKVA